MPFLKFLIFWYITAYGTITKAQFSFTEGPPDPSCYKYEIGESRIVSVPTPWRPQIFQSPLHYKVQRVSESNYVASLALEFSPHWSYDTSFSLDEIHAYYLRKVRHCIDLANTKMRGPNGERLFISIEDARSSRIDLIKHSIQIHNIKGYKDLYGAFLYSASLEQPCYMLVHEIFHLFGFSDNYKHKLLKFVPSGLRTHLSDNIHNKLDHTQIFDCRAIQIGSVMSHSQRRWYNTFNTRSSNKENSLIDPTHFNAILYGNCPYREDVKLFRECNKLSYQNSLFNWTCLSQKTHCERQNILGRDKNKELQRLKDALDYDISSQERLDLEKRIRFVEDWPD